MPLLLMLTGGAGLVAAAAALWVEATKHWTDRRFFAGLLAAAVTLSLFSLLAWAATLIAGIVPLGITWTIVAAFAFAFAMRVYRELRSLPSEERASTDR
jgi:hypothetical protein